MQYAWYADIVDGLLENLNKKFWYFIPALQNKHID